MSLGAQGSRSVAKPEAKYVRAMRGVERAKIHHQSTVQVFHCLSSHVHIDLSVFGYIHKPYDRITLAWST
jgi:hypothetical protein